MTQIHRKLHVDTDFDYSQRITEDLMEQHALGEQNAIAVTNSSPRETVDETELDDELAEIGQQQLDADEIYSLPVVVNGERDPPNLSSKLEYGANALEVKKKQHARQEGDDEEEELTRLQVEMAM
ncbi:ESCRT-III subunit protein snf7 [Pseudogymnoascus verrucosus]|uniref:ESCRT-III subunit protein snf7 n=1 Tax=Pseudogymnoascus verrucosus TaxID=342668 RepID=A0A1B8GR30_9PEZI|nr:ESCRT-III subunit protein snf7 [Pseudogymnoascus verrucosus]OBT98296.1 ESCRT-III subunit protein snf7 [Pseudogymnoascus verrucosus]